MTKTTIDMLAEEAAAAVFDAIEKGGVASKDLVTTAIRRVLADRMQGEANATAQARINEVDDGFERRVRAWLESANSSHEWVRR